MLCITRKSGERFRIGNCVFVTVTKRDGPGDTIRIQIDAPKRIEIMREEADDSGVEWPENTVRTTP